MGITSHSPLKIVRCAWHVGKSVLSDFSHPNSPKRFTQPQLFACLALKCLYKLDYRGTEALIRDCPNIAEAIGLKHVPDHSTLHKAARRLLNLEPSDKLLDGTVRLMMHRKRVVELASIDSTGLEAGQISPYFVRRRSRVPGLWQTTTYKRFPKLGVIIDCKCHLVLAMYATRGPTPDINQMGRTLRRLSPHVRIKRLAADAGYDSESNHCLLREELGVDSIIPPKHGRRPKDPNHKPPTKWRRLMKERFDGKRYGQRWQVETVFSVIKRRLGHSVRERSYWAQCRALRLMTLTYNIMVLL